MSFAISRSELEAAFGPAHVATVPAELLNPAVTHTATARFLAEVGVPDVSDFIYQTVDTVASGLPDLRSERPDIYEIDDLPRTADSWVAMGFCYGDDAVILDGSTGEVRVMVDGEEAPGFLNSSVDLFTLFITAFFRDREYIEAKNLETRKKATDNLVVELRAADSTAFADPESYWYQIVERILYGY
ncbi:MAG: SUKH-4 family immunity protein [Streptomycetaceae bacterium]|nr:SUKH-4 family immunity protein [Streptomycetaceae bacterium]